MNWAELHAKDLISNQSYLTRNWIKTVCDIQDFIEDMDEAIQWKNWRAPKLVVMTPSKFAHYEPDRIWERQDERTSLRWLQRFADDLKLWVHAALQGATGEAKLTDASAIAVTGATAVSTSLDRDPLHPEYLPLSETHLEFKYDEDCRSIRYRGEPYAPTSRQAIIVSILHKGFLTGHPDQSKENLITAIEAETSEVRDQFRETPLWKTLIIPGARRGTYRIGFKSA